MRAVLATSLVATAWAGGTRRVGSDWPHHGVGSAPRIPIGYPLPAPRAVRSPQGRTVVVKGDAAARGNNDAPDLRPWWRRQAIPDVHAAWVEELLKKNCANGSFWLPLTDHGPAKFAQGAALGARSGLLDLKKVSANPHHYFSAGERRDGDARGGTRDVLRQQHGPVLWRAAGSAR